MKTSKLALAMLAGALMIGMAHAEIWKCTNGETGRIEYSGTPCSGRNSTGDRLNAHRQENAGTAASAPVTRQAGAEAATSMPRQEGSSSPAGDNPDCVAAENDYEAARSRRAASAVLQPLKNRVGVACGRAPTGAGIADPVAISSCDGSGCWDVNGERYNATGDNVYSNSVGQTCQKTGKLLRCQ